MADIASLSMQVKFDSVEKSTVALKEHTKAASADERAAQKWGMSQSAAARSADDFSKRVRRTIADLEFERQQLARNATEQARFQALRRAGVSAMSAEGQAITASVRALQAQQSAYDLASKRADVYRKAKIGITTALVAATAAMVAFGKSAFDTASGLDELAEQVGISAKLLQSLQLAATQNGVKTEQLETGLSKFSQKMGEAADGSKEMIEALQKLGVKNLDVQGKLRPTEDLLVDVATAITEIDDPARRAAAAVDFFGKAGTKMLPLLGQIAAGTDNLAASAERAGAVISADASKNLDDFADRLAKAQIIAKVWAAELINDVINASRSFAEFDDNVTKAVSDTFKNLVANAEEWITPIGDKIGQVGASAAAMFIEAFSQLPDALGKLFTNAWAMAKNATMRGVDGITGWLNENLPDSGPLSWLKPNKTNLGGNPDSGVGPSFDTGAITAAGARAAAAMAAQQQAARDAAARQAMINRQAGFEGDEAAARLGKLGAVGARTTGAGMSAVKGAGKEAEDAEKKYQKLLAQLDLTVAAQDRMTEASARGEQAFETLKVHVDAQNKSLEIFGKVLDDSDPKLKAIEERLLRIAQGKAAESFNVATTELEKQNVILEAQIRLMNEAPEIQAREIALIKAKQEAEKAGTAVTAEMMELRRKAIEQNETLKSQQEELKRAQDLWTAPLKRALEDIQSTAADAFASMLESGKFNFEELGNVFKKIVARMAAEFLALATVRPVMSVILNAVAPGMAQQMGVAGGGLGSMNQGGGGLLGGLFGGGGLSNWLGSTIGGGFPSNQYGPPAPGQSWSSGFLGNITWGQGLGAAAGIGMGAYQLFNSKSTAGTIGGIASMVGGAVSLIPGIGQIAGPIISILGSVLPGLFESKPEPPTMRGIGTVDFRGGNFTTTGSGYGGGSAIDLSGVGSGIKSLLQSAKVKLDKLSGSYSIQQQTYAKGDFSNATTFITGPDGRQMQWGQSSDPEMQKQAMDTATAHVAHQMMLEVKSGISDVMREGLSNFGLANLQHAFSTEELSTAVAKLDTLSEAIKHFGETSTEAADAIKAVDEPFNELFNIAAEFKISASEVTKIERERDRKRLEATKDFTNSIDDAFLSLTDPMQAEINALGRARAQELVANDEFLRLVPKYGDRRVQIMEVYEQRIADVQEKYAEDRLQKEKASNQSIIDAVSSSVATIQGLIRQLTPGGALANVDPATQLAGLRASAAASYAQAISDPTNSALIEQAVSDAQALAETSLRFNAGNSAYERDRQMILAQQQALQGASIGAGFNQASDPELKDLLRQLLTASGSQISPDRNSRMDQLINLLIRFFADEAA